jgi:hypothetical protein
MISVFRIVKLSNFFLKEQFTYKKVRGNLQSLDRG